MKHYVPIIRAHSSCGFYVHMPSGYYTFDFTSLAVIPQLLKPVKSMDLRIIGWIMGIDMLMGNTLTKIMMGMEMKRSVILSRAYERGLP